MSVSNILYISLLTTSIYLILGTHYSFSQSTFNEIAAPCQSYLIISIGQIDPEFEITREEVDRITSEANYIWESEIRKTFRALNEEKIIVNFIYNHNSEIGKEEFIWKNKIEDYQIAIQKNRLRYVTDLRGFNKDWKLFETSVNNYDQRRIVWQQRVDEIEIEELRLLQKNLLKKEKELELRKKSLESNYKELRKMRTNRDSLISQYKQRFDFHKDITLGVYERNGNSHTIDIYYFNSTEQLKSILLHEFGHAHGIKHIESNNSIMRHKIEANGIIKAELSPTDIDAINKTCDVHFPE